MARGKKSNRRGGSTSNSNATHSTPKMPRMHRPPPEYSQVHSGAAGHGISMMDEARNTSSSMSRGTRVNWETSDLKFVSSGIFDSKLEVKQPPLDISSDLEQKNSVRVSNAHPDRTKTQSEVQKSHVHASTFEPVLPSSPSFGGLESIISKKKHPRRLSVTSESSEDVVLFAGRTKVSLPSAGDKAHSPKESAETSIPPQQQRDLTELLTPSFSPRTRTKGTRRGRRGRKDRPPNQLLGVASNIDSTDPWYEGPEPELWNRPNKVFLVEDPEDDSENNAAIRDYIANVQAQSTDSENDIQTVAKDTKNIHISETTQVETARAVTHTSATQASAINDLLDGTDAGSDDASSDSSLGTIERAAEDLQDAFDHLDNDDSLYQRTADMMTDEQLARRLAKQEQLGLGSSDVVLLDGDEDSFPRAALEALEQDARDYTRLAKKNGKSRSKLEASSAFVDSMEEDPYLNFDVMDRERASIRYNGKTKRAPPGLDLSDSELEALTLATWENDRSAKKLRREERERLRAEGLLTKNGKPNLKAKYKEGLTWDDIRTEMTAFLISNSQTLALPPMDKHQRKLVHEMARSFNLKTKSEGSGNKRFPMLYRTSKTLPWSGTVFARLEQRYARRFFPRTDRTGGGGTGFSGSKGGGAGSAAVKYRDGDVVGAEAPELGTENRGRAMLERMGWSQGTALGAMNNKGILQPVAQVVKNSKIGLG